jgi:hypothetical protein
MSRTCAAFLSVVQSFNGSTSEHSKRPFQSFQEVNESFEWRVAADRLAGFGHDLLAPD